MAVQALPRGPLQRLLHQSFILHVQRARWSSVSFRTTVLGLQISARAMETPLLLACRQLRAACVGDETVAGTKRLKRRA
jgi:hypothetical protein